ncbi:unnamed protein product [Moneuplotes crassus]|uniref:ADP-ribosylation factor-like protein 2-binding protein n=1 Tax=Euplotes crassus TaxID=5936 RepID=A0AAD1XYP0_EUPCR|nr:unnamed protein product [Moneuplotes crassus]
MESNNIEEEIIGADNDVDMDGEEDEFEISCYGETNQEDDKFDEFVGALQEIVINPEFETIQNSFFNKNCIHFENTEENKLIYMDIFQKYKEVIENYIEENLKDMIQDFNMEEYAALLPERKDEIDEQLLELITSFADFTVFKELMISFRKMVIATTPKHKSAKAAELEKELLEKQKIEVPEGLELLHVSGNKTKIYDDN